MHLEVTFRNLRPREEIRKRALALFAKLERFVDESTGATLEIAVEHGSTWTELNLTSHGQVFLAKDEDEDLRTALDRTFHTMDTNLRRAKERRLDRRRRTTGPEIDGFEAPAEDEEVTGTHAA